MLVGPSVVPLVGPHDEILRNLLTLKTGYMAIASHLGFGVTSWFFSRSKGLAPVSNGLPVLVKK
jgi:hypothetical protein